MINFFFKKIYILLIISWLYVYTSDNAKIKISKKLYFIYNISKLKKKCFDKKYNI